MGPRLTRLLPLLTLALACGESASNSRSDASATAGTHDGGGTETSGGSGGTGGSGGSATGGSGGQSTTGGNGGAGANGGESATAEAGASSTTAGEGGVGAGGQAGASGEGGANGGTGGAGSLMEDCYVATSAGDEARLERDGEGTYTLVSTTLLQSLTFDEATQVLWLGYQFGNESFSAALAPNGRIADATFWSCPISPTQNACLLPMRVATELRTCDGAPVSVESVAGCYDRYGGGLRIEIAGAPGDYSALVTEGNAAPTSWEVRESGTNTPVLLNAYLVVVRPDQLAVQFSVGLTGRLKASAYVSTELSLDGTTAARFVACD